MSPAEILAVLSTTPERLEALADGMTPEQLKTPPELGEWPARDILAHLKSCCDMWGGHIVRMLENDEPVWTAMNPRTWIKQTDYLEQEFEPLMQAFIAQRRDLLDVLTRLSPEQWLRSGTAKGWGQKYARSVIREGDGLARHERAHLKQMERALKVVRTRQYQTYVGRLHRT